VAKPPEPPPSSELDEVERAISALAGRHPEHERTRRETAAAVEQRRKSLEQELTANAKRRRKRLLVIFANALAVVVAAVVAWRLVARSGRIRDSLARDEAPFLLEGFAQVASNELTARPTLEADVPGSSCFVALATEGNVVVHAAASTFSSARSLGWCGCAPGHVTIETAGAGGAPAGLALLRLDGNVSGGPLARAWSKVAPAAWGDGGAECADAMLDAWIADHRWPAPVPTGTELADMTGGSQLARVGFHVSALVGDGSPFAVVDSAAGDCELALAPARELSLRTAGGTRPIEHAKSAMAWCSTSPATVTVWVTGGGRAIVLSAPASRMGGLLGTREAARDASYPVDDGATWLRAEDQGWEAASILRASSITDVVFGALATAPTPPDMRVAAIVAPSGAAVTWEPSLAAVACEPPLGAAGRVVSSVCVPTIPSTLWQKGDAPGFAARGSLPFWMASLAGRHEPDAVALLPELLALARRLAREGFEPTTFEGVAEMKDGVRVVGRAGEDAVVAVGLVPATPWVVPYSDGAPWDLGDAPRVIALQPGAAVTLSAAARSNAPIDRRRTVVFRRSVHP
jgi:hypothetical protein